MGQETSKGWLIRFSQYLLLALQLTIYPTRSMKFICFFLLQDRFKDWESSGIKVVPVLSEPENDWTGESGYVQVGVV